MNPEKLKALLHAVQAGDVEVDSALDRLTNLPFEDIDFAVIDHHRSLRQGFPEVIYGAGKTADEIIAIAQRLHAAGHNVLTTRVSPDQAEAIVAAIPEMVHHPRSRLLFYQAHDIEIVGKGEIAVLSAGTSDGPVAEEAALTARYFGNEVRAISDIGVAGLHRLLSRLPEIQKARILIVVAGMEGALPSVVAGLMNQPVIAVPTSVGYGASMGGLSALLGMLNSCSSGITVVNIDNGFGAAYAASQMNRL